MNKNVLIADDNPHFLRTLSRVLKNRTGLDVCGLAIDGVDAVEKACHSHPDLIILDLCMPEMNGLEATEAIRKAMPGVPVVILTAFMTRFVKAQAAAAGANALIEKGANLAGLISTIQSLLDSGAGSRPPSGV